MAAPKKSTSKASAKPAEVDPDEASGDDVEPLAEEQRDETPASAREATPDEQVDDEPRPWRVETYAVGDQWGWRLCAANGRVLREEPVAHGSREEAAAAAEEEVDDDVILQDRQRSRPSPAW